MSDFMAFDSFEEMQEFMATSEATANEALVPAQIELRDDVEHTRWFCRPYPQLGILIFGEVMSAETLQAKEPEVWRDLLETRKRGYLFGWCYSEVEPSGEPGDTHVAHVMPISQAAFEEAKAHGWKAVRPDRLVELMVPADVLAEKTTPILIAELAEAERLMRGESGG